MTDKPLAVAAFWDTRAGHQKQTRGILEALAKLTPISVSDINLPEPSAGRAVADFFRFTAASLGASTAVTTDSAGDPLPETPDLIIGTGSRAHLPMLALKKARGGRAVTCMTPNPPFGSFMDLMFVPEHDGASPRENILFTLGPPNPARTGEHSPDLGLVLIGGVDEKTHVWDSAKTLDQAREIVRAAPEVRWTLTSSPRTPEAMLSALHALARDHGNAAFFPAGETPRGWIEDRYAESRVAWVTADSASMVYEALTAGCLVGVLPVEWKDPQSKLARGLDALVNKNAVLLFSQWQQNPKTLPPSAKLDEAARCAREILARFFPERL